MYTWGYASRKCNRVIYREKKKLTLLISEVLQSKCFIIFPTVISIFIVSLCILVGCFHSYLASGDLEYAKKSN